MPKIPEEDAKKLQELGGIIAGSLESGLKKLSGVLPDRGVIDPEMWLKV